uniref:Uncharacterized protein n=1 Tax=Arundo donax TaxID=35708 RepID=A0A0A9BY57_ARUDO
MSRRSSSTKLPACRQGEPRPGIPSRLGTKWSRSLSTTRHCLVHTHIHHPPVKCCCLFHVANRAHPGDRLLYAGTLGNSPPRSMPTRNPSPSSRSTSAQAPWMGME